MSHRERIVHGLHNVEDTARESLLHGGEVVTRQAQTLWTHFKVQYHAFCLDCAPMGFVFFVNA
jgi:hypothetical protein